jgi:N-acetylglutamate synthase-like GNAT family acetyltransferase
VLQADRTDSRLKYSIKSGVENVDVKKVCEMLSKTYWGHRRPLDRLEIAIKNSLCYSAYVQDKNEQKIVGFGRVLTDYATFAYFTDVIVDDNYRHQGIGTALMESMRNDDRIKGCYGALSTTDAGSFYATMGFEEDKTFKSRIL